MGFLRFLTILLIILVLIGFIKLKLLCSFVFEEEEFFCRVFFKILFFKFKLFSNFKSDEKFKFRKSHEKEDLRLKKLEKKQNKLKNKKKQSLFEKLGLLYMIFTPTIDLLKFLNRGFKISNFNLNFKLASEDAHKTAVFYGNFCLFFNGFFSLLRSICKVEVKNIKIVPNFKSEKSNYNLSCIMQIGFGRLFIGLLRYIFTIVVRIYLNKSNKNKIKT